MYSPAAERLLMCIGAHESYGFTFIDQITSWDDVKAGPAYGVYQMEGGTHAAIRKYLDRRTDLKAKVDKYLAPMSAPLRQMMGNVYYATAMARIFWWRKPWPLPDVKDTRGMARAWKRDWNTVKGKGTEEAFIANCKKFSV